MKNDFYVTYFFALRAGADQMIRPRCISALSAVFKACSQ
ncbi:hypothetical protein SAMN05660659_05565 [Pseudomonas sp. LAMO17WK12:I6]|nr:hypothetical protein SAMN05660455_04670 [Pseudomonas sp. LAMO17WK12:I5]SNY47750.1 hypothetical protein SAMN05660455_05578 [Pseudomonas sp. LAMO17WK12:I5]SNY48493.1 hypothetical protein SAMN05660659_05565 [Pseudomonas sp. LAMO17WK12:I6]